MDAFTPTELGTQGRWTFMRKAGADDVGASDMGLPSGGSAVWA